LEVIGSQLGVLGALPDSEPNKKPRFGGLHGGAEKAVGTKPEMRMTLPKSHVAWVDSHSTLWGATGQGLQGHQPNHHIQNHSLLDHVKAMPAMHGYALKYGCSENLWMILDASVNVFTRTYQNQFHPM
jgi:hypothetical protein